MADVLVTVLGGFGLRAIGSAEPVTLPTKKCRALLAYLALSKGRPLSRELLATLLWGETPDRLARQSLRYSLGRLRKALPGLTPSPFAVASETIVLDPSTIDVDALEFERLVDDGSPAALANAVSLYRGDLLAGLGLDEPGFDEWLTVERERLHERALEALHRLLAHQIQRQDVEPAIRTALQALALDPLEEPVHRALMRLYLGQGRRAAALKQYQVCVSVLRQELDGEPEAETQALYRQMLGSPRSLAAGRRPEPAVRPAEPVLLGRAAEVARLRGALDAALNGEGRLTVLLGEAGIGKSRLTEELVAMAAATGARAILAHCHETEQALPFAAWVDGLRGAGVVADIPELPGLDGARRRELARLFIELGEPDRSAPIRQDDHLRLFDAMAQLLVELARREPLVVILEDLHWADDMTVRLLGFVSRRLQGPALMVAGTVREEEVQAGSVLGTLIKELERDGVADLLSVLPLSRADTIALGRALLGRRARRALGSAAKDRLWQVSEGNPFVIVETIRSLQDRRADAGSGPALAPGVREMVRAGLERGSVQARHLAAIAAVVGRECSFTLLERVAGMPAAAVASAIEELVRRRVLDAVGEGFRFVHDRVRTAVYEGLAPTYGTALHHAVGSALESLHQGHIERVTEELASHFTKTDDDERAFGYLVRLGDQTAARYALEESVRRWYAALALADRLPAARRDRAAVDVAFRLAHHLYFMSKVSESVRVLEEVADRVTRVADPGVTSRYHFWLGYTLGMAGKVEHAEPNAQRAMAEATRCADGAALGMGHFLQGLSDYWGGRPEAAVGEFRKAATMLEGTDEHWWLGQAYWVLATTLFHIGEFDAALAASDRLRAVARTFGDQRLEACSDWTAALILARRGQYAAAVEAGRRGLDVCRDPFDRGFALWYLGQVYSEQGEYLQAIACLEESVGIFTASAAFKQHRGNFGASLAEAYAMTGRVQEARETATLALQAAESVAYGVGIGSSHRALGRTAWIRGDVHEAEEHLARAVEVFKGITARFLQAQAQILLAEIRTTCAATTAADDVREAHVLCTRIQIPPYESRCARLAKILGIALRGEPILSSDRYWRAEH